MANLKLKTKVPADSSAREIFALILSSLGLKGDKQQEFLHPPEPTLDYLIKETGIKSGTLKNAQKIITGEIKKGSDILVFGDYDADGLTSTAILWLTLMGLAKGSKSRVLPFIPDRTHHGYGLSKQAIEDITNGYAFRTTAFPDFNPTLVVTVDNGIVANQEVKELVDRGIKVIVTDHHQPATSTQLDSGLPPATAIVHSVSTSGAGISWLLSMYLSASNPAVVGLIGIASIGVVADQMPLLGLNRTLAVAGLTNLTSSTKPGILALKEVAGISSRPLTAYDINFALAPRLNAVGRLDNPLDGLRLLCTSSQEQAKKLATTINSHNQNRQELTANSIDDALKKPVSHKIIFVASPDYHEGIIGLVAGKLAEKYHRPAVVVSLGQQVGKGSTRSVPGVNITNILREFQDLFISVGGHEQAAGFSIKLENISRLEESLYSYADTHIDDALLVQSLSVFAELTMSQTTIELARLLTQMEPFGMGNPKPRFLLKDIKVIEQRELGEGGKHLKFVIEKDGISREVIWFNAKEKNLQSLKELVFTLDINSYRGRDSLQLVAQYVQT